MHALRQKRYLQSVGLFSSVIFHCLCIKLWYEYDVRIAVFTLFVSESIPLLTSWVIFHTTKQLVHCHIRIKYLLCTGGNTFKKNTHFGLRVPCPKQYLLRPIPTDAINLLCIG